MDVTHSLKFKLAVLVFKALHGLAPQYPADDCQLVTAAGRRQLRSSDALTCVVQRTRTRLGDRSFAVAGPRLCNSLPAELRHPTISLRQFRQALKTHLFLNWDRRLVTLAFSAPYKCSYLLGMPTVGYASYRLGWTYRLRDVYFSRNRMRQQTA